MKYRLSLVISCVLLCASLCLTPRPVQASSGSTVVTQTLLPGVLGLTVTPTAIMTSTTLNGTNSQTATGSLGLTTVTDARGTGAGWSLTATSTVFSNVSSPAQVVGTTGLLSTAGSYTGSSAGTYTVTIVNGGIVGVATYSVSGLETQTTATSGVGVPLGTKGLSLAFGTGNFAAGDQWTITVRTIPASNLTLTPSAAAVLSGSGTGVTAGSSYTYTTGNDPATIMTASNGNGLGVYTNTPSL